jgi:DNA-binding transcriptional LysR family regulator
MPPLNSLKAFEAAARHESFAKAADELGVTPAAVSHQVKALEQWLGKPLFARHPQGLSLTEVGTRVLPALQERSIQWAKPADLANVPLIFDTSWTRDWPIWFEAAGEPSVATKNGLGFSLFSLALQAAIDGAGVLVAHEPLCGKRPSIGCCCCPVRHNGQDRCIVENPASAKRIARRSGSGGVARRLEAHNSYLGSCRSGGKIESGMACANRRSR